VVFGATAEKAFAEAAKQAPIAIRKREGLDNVLNRIVAALDDAKGVIMDCQQAKCGARWNDAKPYADLYVKILPKSVIQLQVDPSPAIKWSTGTQVAV
jgi:hypothetical protein